MDRREVAVPVDWYEIALVIPVVMVEESAIVLLGSCVKRLLGAAEVDRKAVEGTGSVPSIVLIADVVDEVAGAADVEDASIDDDTSDDMGV